MNNSVSFSGVYKFNTSFKNVQIASSYINNNYKKHQNGYPVSGSDKFVFSAVDSNNDIVAICYDDTKPENYILTDDDAQKASQFYAEMIDGWDYYSQYYAGDKLFNLACEELSERYCDQVKAIVNSAKEEGRVEELGLKVDSESYDSKKPPRFSVVA